MAKANNSPSNKTPYLAVIVILALVVIGMAFAYTQKSSAYAQEINSYSNLNSNYTSFKIQSQDQVSSLQTQISSLQAQLSNISSKYNQAENNLTVPYTKILYNDYTFDIPQLKSTITVLLYNSTYTYNYTYEYLNSTYSYSFNAPYPGYLIFNATSTIANMKNNCYWPMYFSQEKPYIRNESYEFDRGNATYETICPQKGITYYIPVRSGTIYMLIFNENTSSGVQITANLKYVGFHTS